MSSLKPLDPAAVARKLKAGTITLVDVREADERARERIAGAVSAPLSAFETAAAALDGGREVVFHCRSGGRTTAHCDRLAAAVAGQAFVLEGGIEAWKKAGLPVAADRKAPLEIMRQVQIAAGTLVLTGVVLGFLVHPGFFGLSAFVGAGLTFAGLSGWCGMANLLKLAPWNRAAGA
ncbi:rhodanese family protein [Caulobacter sp. 17J80-11]|uniref:rhodanese family protein n=1 Tax=Caulobacter sp. 17J80-11 TaxID=2763502 RepID=UPI001CA41A69|nr:rhodanese family protein [Caulobacter sp. 17J80-11]